LTLNPGPSAVDVRANLAAIRARIAAARESAVAPAKETHLVAVSKGHPAARAREALDAGHRLFGENRVQEAKAKWPELKSAYPDAQLHLIGPLQTNKVKEAVALFDAIHTLDRQRLADALQTEMARQSKSVPLFVEVNIGAEPQKAGVAPKDTAAFLRHCRDTMGLPVIGLMCIPPAGEEPAPYFALMRKLASECGVDNISMGMSADFESAIRFGATHVRVGTAIFGERE
jgi:pyridoxal phosphate enzyme (YggS family)